MLSVQIDEAEVKHMCREQIAEIVRGIDAEMVYWDRKELMKRTCMSWNFIQEQFFFDPRFPKSKIGSKWYFPVRETRKFLEQWIDERQKQ